jgi:hypothetical protein
MKKIARMILAPLLVVALLLTQTAPFANAMAPAKAATCGCHKTVCCCQKPAKSNSIPSPAAPARTVAQNDLQIVAAVVEQVLTGAAASRPSSFQPRSSSAACPIPLYQRNCTLLI